MTDADKYMEDFYNGNPLEWKEEGTEKMWECGKCDGTGKDEYGMGCYNCKGTGKLSEEEMERQYQSDQKWKNMASQEDDYIDGSDVPKDGFYESNATDEYEVDVDEYLKTGEPVQKVPKDKRSYNVETSDAEYQDWIQDKTDEDTTRDNLEKLQEEDGEAKIGDWDDDRISISVMGDDGEFKDVEELTSDEEETVEESFGDCGCKMTNKAKETWEGLTDSDKQLELRDMGVDEGYAYYPFEHLPKKIGEAFVDKFNIEENGDSLGWNKITALERADTLRKIGFTPRDSELVSNLEYQQLSESLKKDVNEALNYKVKAQESQVPQDKSQEAFENGLYSNMYDGYLERRGSRVESKKKQKILENNNFGLDISKVKGVESKANEGYVNIDDHGVYNPIGISDVPSIIGGIAKGYGKKLVKPFQEDKSGEWEIQVKDDNGEWKTYEYGGHYFGKDGADHDAKNLNRVNRVVRKGSGYESKASEYSDAQLDTVLDWFSGASDDYDFDRGVMQCDLCGQTFEPNEREEYLYSHLERAHSDRIGSVESKANEYLPDHFDLDEQRMEEQDEDLSLEDRVICRYCGKKYDLEEYEHEDLDKHLLEIHNIRNVEESKATEKSFSELRRIADDIWENQLDRDTKITILNQQGVWWEDSDYEERADWTLNELDNLGFEPVDINELIDSIFSYADDDPREESDESKATETYYVEWANGGFFETEDMDEAKQKAKDNDGKVFLDDEQVYPAEESKANEFEDDYEIHWSIEEFFKRLPSGKARCVLCGKVIKRYEEPDPDLGRRDPNYYNPSYGSELTYHMQNDHSWYGASDSERVKNQYPEIFGESKATERDFYRSNKEISDQGDDIQAEVEFGKKYSELSDSEKGYIEYIKNEFGDVKSYDEWVTSGTEAQVMGTPMTNYDRFGREWGFSIINHGYGEGSETPYEVGIFLHDEIHKKNDVKGWLNEEEALYYKAKFEVDPIDAFRSIGGQMDSIVNPDFVEQTEDNWNLWESLQDSGEASLSDPDNKKYNMDTDFGFSFSDKEIEALDAETDVELSVDNEANQNRDEDGQFTSDLPEEKNEDYGRDPYRGKVDVPFVEAKESKSKAEEAFDKGASAEEIYSLVDDKGTDDDRSESEEEYLNNLYNKTNANKSAGFSDLQ